MKGLREATGTVGLCGLLRVEETERRHGYWSQVPAIETHSSFRTVIPISVLHVLLGGSVGARPLPVSELPVGIIRSTFLARHLEKEIGFCYLFSTLEQARKRVAKFLKSDPACIRASPEHLRLLGRGPADTKSENYVIIILFLILTMMYADIYETTLPLAFYIAEDTRVLPFTWA